MERIQIIGKIPALKRISEIQQKIGEFEKNLTTEISSGKFQAVLEEAVNKQAEKIKPIEEFLAENKIPEFDAKVASKIQEFKAALTEEIPVEETPVTEKPAKKIPVKEVPSQEIPVQHHTKNAAPLSTEQMILSAARKFGVDSELVRAVATAESNLNQAARSNVGAIGVMQLMPETAKSLGVDPYDEKQNIEGGAHYLRKMLDKFNGDLKNAIAAYNAGPGAVKKYGGVPPYSETQNYVGRVLDFYIK